ncbi:MAG: TonB-dependent siderophore receptor [Rhizobacter sp.]
MKTLSISARRVAAGSGLFVCAASALAQTTEPAQMPAVTVRAKSDLEVVAPKAAAGVLGDLPLVETPFSVNVVTRDLIEKQQVYFLGDFLKNDPSATVGNVAVPFLLLRGFAVGTDGTLYDGLPGHYAFADGRAPLQIVDRVEVMKGASGFLSGVGASGSLGGVVNYVPKRPVDEPVREVSAGFANKSLWNLSADVGDRFGPDRQFGARVNLGWRDGATAVDHYDWRQGVGAIALDWRVQPGLVFTVGGEYVENHLPRLAPFYAVAPGLAVPKAPDAKTNAALSWDDFKTRDTNLYARADWDFTPDWSVSARVMHNEGARPTLPQARFGMIVSEAGDAMLFGGLSGSSNEVNSGQLMVRGKAATGPVKHQLTFGLTGFSDESRGANTSFAGPGPNGSYPTNIYNPVDTAAPAYGPVDLTLSSKTRSDSLLVSDILELTPQWSVLLGARRAKVGVDNHDPATGAVATSQETTKTLPTAALMWKPAQGALVYLNYAEGLEQGGSVSPTVSDRFLPPRMTKQVELGGKLEWRDMLFTGALFDMRRPQEVFDIDVGENVQRGTQRHRGIELLASGRAMPALTVVSGLMFLDTKLSGTGESSDGKHATGVPRVSANVWGEYRLGVVPGLAVNGGVFYSGSQYLDGDNTQEMPSWTRLDLGVNYTTRFGNLPATLLLTVENVADRNYWASAQSGILTMADPRTIKLGLRVSL